MRHLVRFLGQRLVVVAARGLLIGILRYLFDVCWCVSRVNRSNRLKITERKACVVEAGVKILDSAKGSFGAPYLFTKIWPALARFATSPERVDVNT
jgi:hypothetical protein